MDKKTTGYVLSIVGIVNAYILASVGFNMFSFMTFLALAAYGIFLLSKEDTFVKTLFQKIKENKYIAKQSEGAASTSTSSTTTTANTATTTNTNESSKETLKEKKVNYISLIAAALAAIAVFLPWLKVTASYNAMGQSGSFSSGAILGVHIAGGILGLLLALAGGFMAFRQIKWAFIAGAVNFINGIGYMVGWFGAGADAGFTRYSYSSDFGSSKASIDPQIGLYMFVIASLVFIVFSLKNFKTEKAK